MGPMDTHHMGGGVILEAERGGACVFHKELFRKQGRHFFMVKCEHSIMVHKHRDVRGPISMMP